MRPLGFLILPLAACAAGATERPPAADRAASRAADRGAAAEAGLARELAGLRRGTTTDCLPIAATRSAQTKGYGDTIVYIANRGLKYASRTTGGCETIARGDVLVTRTPIGRVCRGDIAQVFEPVARFQTGSCGFGAFTEYRRP